MPVGVAAVCGLRFVFGFHLSCMHDACRSCFAKRICELP